MHTCISTLIIFGTGVPISLNKYNVHQAFQGVKVTSDTALKTGDMGLSKH